MTEATDPETTVAQLFARNPGDLGSSEIELLINKLRDQRNRFTLGDKSAGSPRPPSAAKQKENAALKVTGQLDLGDLGI